MATSQPSGPRSGPEPGSRLAKLALRDQLTTARNRRPLAEIGLLARDVADHLLATREVRDAATVAAYVSIGVEPGTSWLLDGLRAAGKRVVLPVLLPDGDLDWAAHGPADALARGPHGLLEPAGERLGPAAVARADVLVVPGLAVDATGRRLGRGGGSYDRALARARPDALVVALLWDDEVGIRVPVEAHDLPVHVAVTPSRIAHFTPPPPRAAP